MAIATAPPENVVGVVAIDPPIEPYKQSGLVKVLCGDVDPEQSPVLNTARHVLGMEQNRSFVSLLPAICVPSLFLLAGRDSFSLPPDEFFPHKAIVIQGSKHNVLAWAGRTVADEIDQFISSVVPG